MNILFLDDSLKRTASFRSKVPFAKTFLTAQDIIQYMEHNDRPVDVLFLDHDLGGETYVNSGRADTGAEVCRWLSENKKDIHQIIVHSLNYDGARIMKNILNDAGYNVEVVSFLDFEKMIYPAIRKI